MRWASGQNRAGRRSLSREDAARRIAATTVNIDAATDYSSFHHIRTRRTETAAGHAVPAIIPFFESETYQLFGDFSAITV